MALEPLVGLAASSDHVGWGRLGWKTGLIAKNLIFEIRRHQAARFPVL